MNTRSIMVGRFLDVLDSFYPKRLFYAQKKEIFMDPLFYY